jgi:hypothetical protein
MSDIIFTGRAIPGSLSLYLVLDDRRRNSTPDVRLVGRLLVIGIDAEKNKSA